jgi:hypothetical protein
MAEITNKSNLVKRHPLFIIGILLFISRILFMGETFYNVDEAISAVVARAWQTGIIPKIAIWGNTTKPPGMELIYLIVFKLAGENLFAIRLLSLFCVFLMTLITYAICDLLFNNKAAIFSSIFFIVVMGSSFKPRDIMAFNSEIPQMVFVLLATYIFLLGFKKYFYLNLFLSGFFYIIAAIIRQNTLVHFGGLLFYLLFFSDQSLYVKKRISGCLIMLAGAGIGLLPIIHYYANLNGLNELWYHCIISPFLYAGELSFLGVLHKISAVIPRFLINILPVAALALSFLLTRQNKIEQEVIKYPGAKTFILVWFIFSAFSVCLGWRFFGHYFIQVFPALSILAGIECMILFNGKNSSGIRPFLEVLIIFYIILSLFKSNFPYLRERYLKNTKKTVHSLGNIDLYISIGNYIKENTTKDDKIFVWGFGPEIYWYSGRLPAVKDLLCVFTTGFSAGTLNPFSKKSPRSEMIKNAEIIMYNDLFKNRPKYIVDISPVQFSFKSYPIRNYPLINSFIKEGYHQVRKFKKAILYKCGYTACRELRPQGLPQL